MPATKKPEPAVPAAEVRKLIARLDAQYKRHEQDLVDHFHAQQAALLKRYEAAQADLLRVSKERERAYDRRHRNLLESYERMGALLNEQSRNINACVRAVETSKKVAPVLQLRR